MEAMRETWTDERLDYLNRRVDDGFKQVNERFRQVDDRFRQVDRGSIASMPSWGESMTGLTRFSVR